MTVTPIRPPETETPSEHPSIPTTTIIRIQRGVAAGLGASLSALGMALAITAYGDRTRDHAYLAGLAATVIGAACWQIAASRDAQLTMTATQEHLNRRMASVLRIESAVLSLLEKARRLS